MQQGPPAPKDQKRERKQRLWEYGNGERTVALQDVQIYPTRRRPTASFLQLLRLSEQNPEW